MAQSRPDRRRRTGAGRKRPDEAMHLSHEDLTQLDEAVLQDLEERVLRALSVKLLADLKEAHERLGRTPSNSSRPPSSRAPWDGASNPAQEPSKDSAESEGLAADAKRPDIQAPTSATESPGRPGHGRTQAPDGA